ncbi:MAG: hypothetical protein EBY32_09930 [Proteobacteria bacterium]|nr:hypothetical protein [Pseudomonadota bacterium]
MKALEKLKTSILGGRSLPKPTPPRQRLKPSEARAVLKKFVATLRAMESERTACELANSTLEAAQKQDLSALWQAGEDLPDLAGIKQRFENASLRAQAAAAAGNATAGGAAIAISDLGGDTREKLEAVRNSLEKSISVKLGISKLNAHPSSIRDILIRTAEGETLAKLGAIPEPSLPIRMIEPAGAELSRDGKRVSVELCPALLPWRTSPIPKDLRDKHGNSDQWNPLEVAGDLERFVAHSEAVEKFTESLAV